MTVKRKKVVNVFLGKRRKSKQKMKWKRKSLQ